jgi:hypothetical protein
MKNTFKMAAASLGLALMVSAPAQAQCTLIDITLLNSGTNATQCWSVLTGPPAVNDSPANVLPTLNGYLHGAGWAFSGKSEAGLLGDYFAAPNPAGLTTGSLSFNPSITGTFAISLKGGSGGFSLYVFETPSEVVGFSFSTANALGGAALSHASLWTSDFSEPFSVPEPSSFAMMFAGLFGLGIAARRRRNA